MDWKDIQLTILSYRESGTFIVKVTDEITRLLDDNIVMMQSMSFSPFKKPFLERLNGWDSRLQLVQEVLESLMLCQKGWLYLEPIFSSNDINQQLPLESKRFQTVDKSWRRIMSQARARPGVVELCADVKLLESLHDSNRLLEAVAKGLSTYLEGKRFLFPRFFFLSDDEMLQILSQTKDPLAVQPHMRKCFENISKLEFVPVTNEIVGMHSADGETIPFNVPFFPTGNVEEWLLCVESTMKASILNVLSEGIGKHFDFPLILGKNCTF